GFQNYSLPKKRMGELIMECYKVVGLEKTVKFLDNLKTLGFAEATRAALSMGVTDVKTPPNKSKYIKDGHQRVEVVKKQNSDGIITDGETHSKTISIWTEITDRLSEELYQLINQSDYE